MDRIQDTGVGTNYQSRNISTNTILIWKSTTRLAQLRTLMDNLCLSTCSNDATIFFSRETDSQALLNCIDDDEDDSLKKMINDMCTGPQEIGRFKMILYHCLVSMSENLTQDILFRTKHCKFFEDLEQLLSRLSDETAASTMQEIMRHLMEAKKRHAKQFAKRNRTRHLLLQRKQKMSTASSTALPTTKGPSSTPITAPREP